jgi:cell division protein FtsQ
VSMAKKNSDELTPRQRQSQRIMREKIQRKRRLVWKRRVQMAGAAFFAVTLLGGGGWLWVSGVGVKIATNTITGVYRLTAKAGFDIEAVYLEGRSRTGQDEINKALALTKGQSIFAADLDLMRMSLEKIDSVKIAAVERALPHTLYVRIVEREPVALWQNNGKIALVDDNGVVMSGIDSTPYAHLPLIIGDGAPARVAELITILASEPDLAKRFAAAIYTGSRRWNIRFDNGSEVKLPEKNPLSAWKALADLQTKQQLLDRAVKVVDLRLPDRLFITLSPQDMPRAKSTNAKET